MFIEKINYVLAENPFDRTGTKVLSFGADSWVGYVFGTLFLIIGLACFFLYPRAKRKADQYKKDQLEEYNKVKKVKTSDYSRTGMFLPAWEKAKLFAPVFFGLVLALVGIAWLIGNTMTSL